MKDSLFFTHSNNFYLILESLRYSKIVIRIMSLFLFKRLLFILSLFSSKLPGFCEKGPQNLQSHQVLSTCKYRRRKKPISDSHSECWERALTTTYLSHFWNSYKCIRGTSFIVPSSFPPPTYPPEHLSSPSWSGPCVDDTIWKRRSFQKLWQTNYQR